jgi:metal-responsive CopG/Arc/MetJ family transcriptional regulator
MKVKTSVTLSEELLKRVDRAGVRGESRSSTIERLVAESLDAQGRRAANEQERSRLDQHAEELNAEVEDVLGYQADL